jgi:hypothetical protein
MTTAIKYVVLVVLVVLVVPSWLSAFSLRLGAFA